MPVTALDYTPVRLLIEAESDPEIKYRAHACAKEPWTVAVIEQAAAETPGAVWWDVGANTGPYSLIAIALGLRCVAIEPGYQNYARLCHNLALNHFLDRPLVLCGALGETPGFAPFHYADLRPGAASHTLGGDRPAGFHRQNVVVYRLDDLVAGTGLEGPHWLKIDVDGGEIGVLRGGEAFLRSPELRGIVLEMQPELEAEATAILAAAGWSVVERHAPRQGVAYGVFRR